MAQRFDKEDADEWREKVDELTKRVENILSGDIDCMEEETRFEEEQKIKVVKKEIRQREHEERVARGIDGRGFKGNFKTFCKGCHTEYHHEAVEICNRCGKETVPNEVSQRVLPAHFGKLFLVESFLEVSRKFLASN